MGRPQSGQSLAPEGRGEPQFEQTLDFLEASDDAMGGYRSLSDSSEGGRPRGEVLKIELQADVEGADRMSQRADGDEIDAGFRCGADGF